jgi:hypothetical protein
LTIGTRVGTGLAVGARVAVAEGATMAVGVAGTVGDAGGSGCGAGRQAANVMSTMMLTIRVQKDLFISILSWLKTLPQEGNLREDEAARVL